MGMRSNFQIQPQLNIVPIERIQIPTNSHDQLAPIIAPVGRRILKGETIQHEEKAFSLFEPPTQSINKGKAGCPVELGRKLLITSDQYLNDGFLYFPRQIIEIALDIRALRDTLGA